MNNIINRKTSQINMNNFKANETIKVGLSANCR